MKGFYYANKERRRSSFQHLTSISGGFTIVELIVVSAIGAVILFAATTSLIPQIRTSTNQLIIRSLNDEWGMINFFLDSEISEASCASSSGSTLSLFSTFDCSGTALITYSLAGSTLSRTGPPINDNGSLGTGSVTSVLSENVTAFTPNTSTAPASSRQPFYTVTLSSSGLEYTGLASSARMRLSEF
ncbi:prepilin-type N-terminal cleavage/methylation domain-containing protein [Synechococcus sp. CCY 9618]|uniref:prepilin-type N-terminal cleavage/methylation domain-containing protein n=1 Tax=Synechococcus sp. CCY 9618 TaxID=2815602 RepID=UPI001C24B0D0|nr:prepilin-type N-terminal cleavage/methylation domain-containing protein [Synechococcus sp. CCY 9618]